MVEEYKKWLASTIVTENQIVTYRLLSRALKVHHNVAKRMLFDFHKQQNSKKSGSIHATYLITGIQTLTPEPPQVTNGDEDIPMPSSPYMSSPAVPENQTPAEPIRQRVITLAKEENLEAVKGRYESISSVHVYSLEPSTLQNLEALSAVTQKIVADYAFEDPLTHNKAYGVIHNPDVKRRSGARAPPAPLPVKQETKTAFAKTKDPKTSGGNKVLPNPKEAPPGSGEQATKVGAPSLLKRESSDLFKSFAKSKPKAAKAETKPVKASDDVPMKDVSSDDDGDDVEEPLEEPSAASIAKRKLRQENQEKLRKLMEESDDDETMPDAKDPNVESEVEDAVEEPEEPSAPLDVSETKPKIEEQEDEEPAVTVSGGRRRGRRKVMKKKTTKDAEGFLVTKEEAVWESFSEDEAPPPSKPKVSSSANTNKAKKATGKPGQGNIMNFFGKK